MSRTVYPEIPARVEYAAEGNLEQVRDQVRLDAVMLDRFRGHERLLQVSAIATIGRSVSGH